MRFVGKFRIDGVERVMWNPNVRRVRMGAVSHGSPENERFHQYTPQGEIILTVDNPQLTEAFDANLGKTFYGEFTLAAD